MTTITITFIYDFNKNLIKNDKGSSQKKNKPKKEKKKAKGVQSKEKNKEEEKNEEISTVVKVKKPIRYLHIEYTLLPGKLNYKVDVVFWGTIAKVFTNDGVKSVKSINENGHCWVAFSINHKLLFSENELLKFKSCNANFLSTTSKNKLSASAKKEGEKTFYFNEEDIELKSVFAEAYEIIPEKIENVEIDKATQNINDVKYILNDLLKFATLTETQSELYIVPDKTHQSKVMKVIQKVSSNKIINCSNNLEEPLNVNELLNVKKSGKSKKAKAKAKSKPDSSQIIVPIELFFTDPNMTLYNLKLSNADISNSYVCINVQRMINADQKHNLHPIVIKIDKVLNMPIQILEDHGFYLIYVAYKFCNIDYKTGARPITEKIRFFDHRIYFIDGEYMDQLSEIIQHDYLICQIHGIRRTIIEKGEMFGQNKMDEFISEPLQSCQDEVRKYTEGEKEINNKSVLLAISRVYLSELIKPFWKLSKIEPCVHPRYLNYLSPKYNLFEKITLNEINIEYLNIFEQNPITEDLILDKSISLKVQVNLLNPLVSTLTRHIKSDEVHNRIIMIIHSLDIARTMVFNIFLHNAHWTIKKNIVPNYLTPKSDTDDTTTKNVITGFCVGGMYYCIMFLEGNRNLMYNFLWASIRREKIKEINVMYNSDYAYQNRMYGSFINYGGVYFISTKISLTYLFNNYKSFIKGHMPEPCRRAIQKLDLLVKSSYVRDLPDSIFPTVKEILSLGIEWGVPLHWPLK